MFLKTLSGRFLILTALFVLLAEVLILLPSVARFREDYIRSRLERAQIASLSLLAAGDAIDKSVERELLANAEVYNVVLRRDAVRQLVLSSPIPQPIAATYDMRDPSIGTLIHDAITTLLTPENRIIRVIGDPVKQAGMLIEATMDSGPMRQAMITYALQVLTLSATIAVLTALLLFYAVRRVLLLPIRRVVDHMTAYAEAPEDARLVIVPQSGVVELHDAEVAFQAMQMQVTGALKQKDRLAQLGGAVARISHDLRNILTTAQLMTDRLEGSSDPAVARAAPKLVGSISRAVTLCESTLAFGKAEEPTPSLSRFNLSALVAEVTEGEAMAADRLDGAEPIEFLTDVPPGLSIRADRDQLFRVLANLVRNARQAIEATRQPGTIEIGAGEDEQEWWIRIGDTGPGLPKKARDFLFQPFSGGSRKGGTGLGLAIAADLVRNHGGRLELLRSDEDGTQFMLHLPRELAIPVSRVEIP